MSVIQQIRDKYARVAVIAIGLALLGFILMDAFAGRGSFFGDQDTSIGKINGKTIESTGFMRKASDLSKREGFQGENGTMQAVNALWQQEITDAVMGEQYEELGITISDRELDQMLFGPNPPKEFLQYFGDPQNPQSYDPGAARQQYNQVKKTGNPDQKAFLVELVDYIKKQALQTKYNALLINSVYIPKWYLEKRNIDNSQVANAAYVAVPYTTIADSAVKVTDAEINEYVKAHPKEYEQKEESRSISYVQFSAAPSAADSAAVQSKVMAGRDSFQATNNVKEFLLNSKSMLQYNDAFIFERDFNVQNKDSIFKAPVGAVVGPFAENGALFLTRVIEKSTKPDTAKVRHILVGLTPQAANGAAAQPRDTLVAKRLADSIQQLIAGGQNFDSLLKLSDDVASVTKGGVYDDITREAQYVPEFKDFALNGKPGDKGVVKTQFGYHYMEIMSQSNSPAYKLAVFAQPIEASPETVNQANNEATMFAGNAKDEKTFNDYFEKTLKAKGYNKAVATNLRPMDFTITGVAGQSRDLVKAIFKAKKGDVLDPLFIGSNYTVAVVTDVEKAGLPSANAVRAMIEPVLRNKKKADLILKQMGTVTDLNAVATKFNQQVQRADSVGFNGTGALGFESKVLGAVFNPANKGKVCAEGIVGQAGVYAIRTDAVFSRPVENAGIEEQRKMQEMQSRQQFRTPVDLLQKRAEIKDYRAKFY